MEQLRLGEMEQRFAELIWKNAPIRSMELLKLCESEFGWKKSTMFTMLKRLCERGLFQNESGLVTVVMEKDTFFAAQSERFVKDTYNGSLPKFIAAFVGRNKISKAEIEEIQALIDTYKEE